MGRNRIFFIYLFLIIAVLWQWPERKVTVTFGDCHFSSSHSLDTSRRALRPLANDEANKRPEIESHLSETIKIGWAVGDLVPNIFARIDRGAKRAREQASLWADEEDILWLRRKIGQDRRYKSFIARAGKRNAGYTLCYQGGSGAPLVIISLEVNPNYKDMGVEEAMIQWLKNSEASDINFSRIIWPVSEAQFLPKEDVKVKMKDIVSGVGFTIPKRLHHNLSQIENYMQPGSWGRFPKCQFWPQADPLIFVAEDLPS